MVWRCLLARDGLPKILHWLRHNPEKRRPVRHRPRALRFIVAMLTGVTKPQHVVRSVCAAGHKWLWNEAAGGLPSDAFLQSVDPLFANFRSQVSERFATADKIAGKLCPEWAARLGLRAGIPIPVAALDAHCDAIGAGIAEGDVVNVVGTSTCVMAIVRDTPPIEGVFGIVPGSIHPQFRGIEAGISAAGDIFEAIARRANSDLMELSRGLEAYRAGQTGLLRLVWDNGDRNVLSNAALSGATLGWRLHHTARDELFAAIEGTAFHTRIILERLTENGVPVDRVINGGGIPQKNRVLNQVYANVFNKPVLVPKSEITSLGSAIFAFLAAGVYPSVEGAQAALTPDYDVVHPEPSNAAVYNRMYPIYRDLYFEWGRKVLAFWRRRWFVRTAVAPCTRLSNVARKTFRTAVQRFPFASLSHEIISDFSVFCCASESSRVADSALNLPRVCRHMPNRVRRRSRSSQLRRSAERACHQRCQHWRSAMTWSCTALRLEA